MCPYSYVYSIAHASLFVVFLRRKPHFCRYSDYILTGNGSTEPYLRTAQYLLHDAFSDRCAKSDRSGYTASRPGKLKEGLGRGKSWPIEAQEELARMAHEIEGELKGDYYATAEELRAIDEAD